MGAAALDFHPATTSVSTKTPSDPSLGLHSPRPGSQAPQWHSVSDSANQSKGKKKKKCKQGNQVLHRHYP